jgi:hypothetical protein
VGKGIKTRLWAFWTHYCPVLWAGWWGVFSPQPPKGEKTGRCIFFRWHPAASSRRDSYAGAVDASGFGLFIVLGKKLL